MLEMLKQPSTRCPAFVENCLAVPNEVLQLGILHV